MSSPQQRPGAASPGVNGAVPSQAAGDVAGLLVRARIASLATQRTVLLAKLRELGKLHTGERRMMCLGGRHVCKQAYHTTMVAGVAFAPWTTVN
jgi:hypothetical protein